MTPGTLILLGTPFPPALTEALKAQGHHVITPTPPDPPTDHRYVAGCALTIATSTPTSPLILIAHGPTGPLLPALALSQRAAKRQIGAYVFIDTDLPTPANDWPDAPCAYLSTTPDDPRSKNATLRAWPTTETTPDSLPEALLLLIETL